MDFEQRVRDLHASGTLSLTKAAEALGISRFALKDLIVVMGLVWPKVSRGGKHTIDGVTDTLANHAKRYNTTIAGVRWSLERGIPVEPKRFSPVTAEEALRFIIFKQEGNSVKASAEKVGRPSNTLRRAANKFFPDGIAHVSAHTLRKAAANEETARQEKRRA